MEIASCYGGRNLDFETETTTEFAQTEIIQKIRTTFKRIILPQQDFKSASPEWNYGNWKQ
jgi:hypothetical protein